MGGRSDDENAGPLPRPPSAAHNPVPPPVTRPARRPDPLWARLLVIVGALLMVVSGSAVVGAKFLIARYTGNVNQANLIDGDAAATGTTTGSTITGAINLLLVGIDERVTDPASGARSDSIIVLHIPASHDGAYLVSIPRDSRVTIPAFKKTGYAGGTDKINAAFEFGFQNGGGRTGGFQLLALTVHQLTGLTFQGGAIVNFDGFTSIVDSLGGVDLYVDEEVTSVHIGWNIKTGKQGWPYRLVPPDYHAVAIPGMRPQVYHPGWQHMNGWQALDYVRQRELLDGGDYGRQRHQQQFIKALAKKTAGTANLLTIDKVLRAAGKTVTFDGNGVPIEDWLFTLKNINLANVLTLKTNNGTFHSQTIDGQSFEILDDTSLQMFHALATDQIGEFVANHSTVVNSNTAS